MTELGSRPERRLTELWHFGGVRARGAQACHDVSRARLDSAKRHWQGSPKDKRMHNADTYAIIAFENAFGRERAVTMVPLLR